MKDTGQISRWTLILLSPALFHSILEVYGVPYWQRLGAFVMAGVFYTALYCGGKFK